MRQAIMTAPGAIELHSVRDARAGRGQVLLKIGRIGVRGSDVHVYHGTHPFVSYPVVQGHEFFAVVEAVGEGVAGIRPGMKVTGHAAGGVRRLPPVPARALQCLRKPGRAGLQVSRRGAGPKPPIDMARVGEHELLMIGSMMYRHEDYEKAVEWMAGGAILTRPLESRHFPLERCADAYRYIEEQGVRSMKVFVDL